MRNKVVMPTLILIIALLISLSLTGCQDEGGETTELSMLGGGKTFAVPTGTVADQFVLTKFPDAKIKYYNSALDCAIAVKNGKADAAVYDMPVLKNIAAKNEGLFVLPELLCEDNYGFAMGLQNKELKNVIDSVVAELKANGAYDDMMKRWFPEKGNPAPMPEIKLAGKKGVLRFGTAAVTEPLSFVDSSRKVVGFDIELASYIAKKLDMRLEIVNMDFGAMIPALTAGKVDMIGSGMSITEERAKEVLFSESYYNGGIAAAVRSDTKTAGQNKSAKLKTVDDLKDKRIGVLLGSVHDTYATKNFPNATVMQYKSPTDMYLAVKSGKVDAAFYASEMLFEILQSDKEIGILCDRLYADPIGMGFNKDNDILREKFNEFLKQIKENGLLDDMINRWMKNGGITMPVIENPKNNGVLTVGMVSDKGLPFTIVKDNKLIGFDVELVERFAAYLGKELKISDMEFGSLIAAVSTNKINMIASTLMITDERKQKIDFSDPYYELGASVFALKKNIASVPQAKLAKLDDIANKRVGVYTGTVHDAFVAQKYPQAKIMRYDSTADMVLAIKSDKIDVAMLDLITAGILLKNNSDMGLLTDQALTLPLGIGFNKNNPVLRDKFNNFLEKTRSDGIYAEMSKRWFENDPEKAVMPDIPNSDVSEKVTLGVSVEDIPYVACMNGKYIGFDIEMVERFAAHEGLRLEIASMRFASLVAALASGKVDMIADGIAITEERSKQVGFSDSYADFKTAVIGLKKSIAGYDELSNTTVAMPFLQNLADSFQSNIIHENRYLLLVDGLKITAVISLLAVLFGTLLGAFICFMRMSKMKFPVAIAKCYISIMRGTPVLVLLMIIFYVVFAKVNINPVIAAVIAFSANFAAYVSEMFRTSIESVDKGQEEAGIAGGFTKTQTFLNIIMPQAARHVLPVYKGEFISLVKMTSVVGYIAVQDLTKASDIIRSRTFDAFFPLIMVAVLYFLVSWLLALALDYIGIKISPKRNRKTR